MLIPLAAAVYEYVWLDPNVELVYEYIYEEELDGDYLVDQEGLTYFAFFLIIAIVIWLVSFIGLFWFKNWARHVYVFSNLLLLSAYPYFGLSIYAGFSAMLYETGAMIAGGVLAMLYFSPVADSFRE